LAKRIETRENARVIQRAILVVMQSGNTKKAADKQAITLRSAAPAVNELLKSSTAALARLSDQILPEVRAHSSSHYVDTGKVSEYFGEVTPQHAALVRATVHAVGLEDDLPRSTRAGSVSHLVGVNITTATRGWFPSGGICDVVVHIPTHAVTRLLHDVLLDIAMYYSWPALVRRYSAPSAAAVGIDAQKVGFALNRKLSTAYGPIDPAAGYYAFASSCHRPDGFDYEKYERLWREFVVSLLPPEEVADPGLPPTEQIFQYCRFRGELSPAAVAQVLAPLPPGAYFLVRYFRNPPRSIDVRRVSQLFSSRKARRGSLTAIAAKELEMIARYFDYLQIFKFVVR
jgi:hypothetical protein